MKITLGRWTVQVTRTQPQPTLPPPYPTTAELAEAGIRPTWLYTGCCGRWTPADGCPCHTGRPAMSLATRQLG